MDSEAEGELTKLIIGKRLTSFHYQSRLATYSKFKYPKGPSKLPISAGLICGIRKRDSYDWKISVKFSCFSMSMHKLRKTTVNANLSLKQISKKLIKTVGETYHDFQQQSVGVFRQTKNSRPRSQKTCPIFYDQTLCKRCLQPK